jgi:DNA ligase-1
LALVLVPALALPTSLAWAQPAAVPALLLANVYNQQIDPTLYLVSEKYDGVRALWDGTTLRFRSGRTVPAPAWFTAKLPKQALDGELWLGRGQFDALSTIVRREVALDDEWKQVRFMVFELPDAPGSFAERALTIRDLVQRTGWAQLQAVEQTRVADRKALQRRLADTVAGGGEGLMLHLASAPYGTGRSDVLLKLKPYLDSEAVVVGHRPGKGKYAGQMGALQVQTPEGRRFFIGTGFSDAQRRDPPPLGSSVTYRYRDLTSTGLPRFASFLRVYSAP